MAAAKVQKATVSQKLITMTYFKGMEHVTLHLKMPQLTLIDLFERNKDKSKYNRCIFQLACELNIRGFWIEGECMVVRFEDNVAVKRFRYLGKLCCFLLDLLDDMKENNYLLNKSDIRKMCKNINTHLKSYTDNIDEIIQKCIEGSFKV